MKRFDSTCRKPWENLLVEANGDCYFCCFIIRPGGKIGNLTKKGLEDIWNSRKARSIRRGVVRGKISYHCQICPYFGEFKQEKKWFYRSYFFGRKIMDAILDYAQGGFTQKRVRFVLKKYFG